MALSPVIKIREHSAIGTQQSALSIQPWTWMDTNRSSSRGERGEAECIALV